MNTAAAPARSREVGICLVSAVHGRIPDILFDQNYLFALRDRDAHAENVLITHFSRPVHSKLRARLRSPELVEDACQETFLRVLTYFRAGKMLDNPAALPGFIHSVCHNVALEFLRAHTRQSQMPENAPEPKDYAPSPEGLMVTAERKGLVARVLEELPERDRQLLRRVFLDEADKDEVCGEFQVDPNYLRVLLHRARGRFRTIALRSMAATEF